MERIQPINRRWIPGNYEYKTVSIARLISINLIKKTLSIEIHLSQVYPKLNLSQRVVYLQPRVRCFCCSESNVSFFFCRFEIFTFVSFRTSAFHSFGDPYIYMYTTTQDTSVCNTESIFHLHLKLFHVSSTATAVSDEDVKNKQLHEFRISQ